jgi:hypothetical protein
VLAVSGRVSVGRFRLVGGMVSSGSEKLGWSLEHAGGHIDPDFHICIENGDRFLLNDILLF